MEELLSSLSNLKIGGSKDEQMKFDNFKQKILSKLDRSQIQILKELKNHHLNTWFHHVLVARDTYYIAKNLNYPHRMIMTLTLGALFHDIGKLDIPEVILDLKNQEIKEIWTSYYPEESYTGGTLEINIITLNDTINYLSSKSENPEKYKLDFLNWIQKKGLNSYLNSSLREYFNHHQDSTKKILTNLGLDKEIILFASSHHLDYFDLDEKKKLPLECRIIEFSDKFNAITQSEGCRNYVLKKSRATALKMIFNMSEKDNICFYGNLNRKILRILSEKYLISDFEVLNSKIRKFCKSVLIFDYFNIELLKKFTLEFEELLDEVSSFIYLSSFEVEIFDSNRLVELEGFKQNLIDIQLKFLNTDEIKS